MPWATIFCVLTISLIGAAAARLRVPRPPHDFLDFADLDFELLRAAQLAQLVLHAPHLLTGSSQGLGSLRRHLLAQRLGGLLELTLQPLQPSLLLRLLLLLALQPLELALVALQPSPRLFILGMVLHLPLQPSLLVLQLLPLGLPLLLFFLLALSLRRAVEAASELLPFCSGESGLAASSWARASAAAASFLSSSWAACRSSRASASATFCVKRSWASSLAVDASACFSCSASASGRRGRSA